MKEKNSKWGLYKNVNVSVKLLDFVIFGGIAAIFLVAVFALI